VSTPAEAASPATADLCDAHSEELQVCEPIFHDYGGRRAFHGAVCTLRCFEDNSLLKSAVEEPGAGRVLVVDGGGSRRRALLGGNLAATAARNGWAGVLLYGCVRDSAELAALPLGVRALGSVPLRSDKRGVGEREVAVRFAGVTFRPGDYVYADADGVVLAHTRLA
jgi:regulator of ribonuclease activity A